jgi:cystathionine beta-lyase/cystathionine gamma-synthase
MERHCSSAHRIAEYLESHPRIKETYYPGLPSHPQHAVARRQMRAFGGMVSFEIEGTAENAKKFAEALKIFMLAESLGGVESIVGYPTLMSHGCMTEEERQAKGIRPTHLRLSVGIEEVEDLIDDIEQALAKAFADERELVTA